MTVNFQNLLYQKYGQDAQLTPIKSGTSKEIYIVAKAEDKFIVLINKSRYPMKEYRVLMANNLQKNLFLQGFNAPKVREIYRLAGNIVCCHDYIEGNKIEKLDREKAYLIGKTVAQFHMAANRSLPDASALPVLYRSIFVAKKLRWLVRDFLYRFKYPLWSKLPKGICHYDLNFNNFIFNKEKVFLIDYDRHRYWPFACALERFFKNDGSKEYTQDFFAGYNSVRKLNEDERKFLEKYSYE